MDVRRLAALALALIAVAGCGTGDDERRTATAPGANTAEPQSPAQPATTTEEPAPAEEADQGGRDTRVPPIPRGSFRQGGPDPELFFLFPDEQDARAAAAELNDHGYRVRTAPPAADVRDWSVIAEGTPQGRLAEAEDAFRAWAKARGGRYDGNEIAVGP